MLAKDATRKDISDMKKRLLKSKELLIFNYETNAAITMVNGHKKIIMRQEEEKYDGIYQ
uniref:Uncharacterized protein n=1 Tax=Siphoviridae sp. cthu813 TaxID=2825618 RepID=A0A8S5VI50_9CAUD|nr:MAG TPA: hypothetical protein [Siphoviridae sp. cthu813]